MKHQIIYMVCAFAFTALLAVNGRGGSEEAQVFPTARKLLTASNNVNISSEDYGGDGSPNRIGSGGEGCSKDSLLLDQAQTLPLPSGIPTYTVYIQNVCVLSERCSISDIHLSCGWFSTARSINPTVFRRLDYNDCLVNDGKPLYPGQSISFSYADTFAYPLAVASLTCS